MFNLAELYIRPELKNDEVLKLIGQIVEITQKPYECPQTAWFEIEVRENEDTSEPDFVSWPTIVQLEKFEDARMSDFVAAFKSIQDLLRESGKEVVVAADFEDQL